VVEWGDRKSEDIKKSEFLGPRRKEGEQKTSLVREGRRKKEEAGDRRKSKEVDLPGKGPKSDRHGVPERKKGGPASDVEESETGEARENKKKGTNAGRHRERKNRAQEKGKGPRPAQSGSEKGFETRKKRDTKQREK